MLKVSFIVRKCKKYLKLSTLKEFLFRTLSSPSTLCAKNKSFPGSEPRVRLQLFSLWAVPTIIYKLYLKWRKSSQDD